jgi:TRAP-type uncharacterized transport system fused permease subunit
VLISSGTAAVGVAALAAAFGAWLMAPLARVDRWLLGAGGGLLVYASTWADLAGFTLIALVLLLHYRGHSRQRR